MAVDVAQERRVHAGDVDQQMSGWHTIVWAPLERGKTRDLALGLSATPPAMSQQGVLSRQLTICACSWDGIAIVGVARGVGRVGVVVGFDKGRTGFVNEKKSRTFSQLPENPTPPKFAESGAATLLV